MPIPDLDNLPEDKSDDESEPLSKSPSPEKEEKTKEDTDKSDAGDQTKTDAPKQSDQTDSEAKKVKEWVVVLGGATSVGKYGIQVSS